MEKSELDIGDFIDIEDINKRIQTWILLRDNAKKVIIFLTGALVGYLFAGGSLLLGGIIAAVSLFFSVTQSGNSIVDYLIDGIQGLFIKNPEKELEEAEAELKTK